MNDVPSLPPTGDEPVSPIESRDYYTVMIHFYRGELGRIMTWRTRLDVTTNWAILGSTGMITFGLSSPRNSHLIFMLANVLVMLLLTIEARRYRYYDAFRARVRMLESHFIMPVLLRDTKLLQGDWREVLGEDLLQPSFKMSRLTAIARRFRRNYAWIFLLVLFAWFLKIWIHYPTSHTLVGFEQVLMESNPMPAIAFLLLVATFYASLGFLFVYALLMKHPSGEFSPRAMRRTKWMK